MINTSETHYDIKDFETYTDNKEFVTAKFKGKLHRQYSKLSYSAEAERYLQKLLKEYDIPLSYDEIIPGSYSLDFECIAYSEKLNGLFMHPLADMSTYLYKLHLTSIYSDLAIEIDYASLMHKQNEDQGKYDLEEYTEEVDTVIMLSGSCWMKTTIDWELVDSVMQDKTTKIKVHPSTTLKVQDELKTRYGEDKIIDRYVSGFQVMLKAKTMYITSLTEFNVWGIVYGKQIKSLQPKQSEFNTIFAVLHSEISTDTEQNKVLLNKLLNGKSGLIFPQYDSNWKSTMKELLGYYVGTREEYLGKYKN